MTRHLNNGTHYNQHNNKTSGKSLIYLWCKVNEGIKSMIISGGVSLQLPGAIWADMHVFRPWHQSKRMEFFDLLGTMSQNLAPLREEQGGGP